MLISIFYCSTLGDNVTFLNLIAKEGANQYFSDMATESPIRISGAGGKWPSLKEAASFSSPSRNMAAEDLGILLKGHRFHSGGKDVVPNRSGSAPPNMEGSFLAIENLLSQQNFTQSASLETLTRAMHKCESTEQLCSHPAYLELLIQFQPTFSLLISWKIAIWYVILVVLTIIRDYLPQMIAVKLLYICHEGLLLHTRKSLRMINHPNSHMIMS